MRATALERTPISARRVLVARRLDVPLPRVFFAIPQVYSTATVQKSERSAEGHSKTTYASQIWIPGYESLDTLPPWYADPIIIAVLLSTFIIQIQPWALVCLPNAF